MLLLLLACTSPKDDSADPGPAAAPCWDDLAVGASAVVAEGFVDGTEGIALVGERLFVSVPDGVVEVLPDGSNVPLVTTGHALGLAPRGGGLLLADPGEFTLDGSGADGRVLAIGLDGSVETLAEGLPNPNFVAVTPWGTVLVSDDTNETLWELDDGATVWLEGIPSPNGLGFSPAGDALYVATTFLPDPPIWAVPVGADHAPGSAEALTTFATASAPDGLAVTADGRVLVAANLAGALIEVDPGTGGTAVLAQDLESPASLAFGDGLTWDACSVYVTSLYGSVVTRVSVGQTGAPLPE